MPKTRRQDVSNQTVVLACQGFCFREIEVRICRCIAKLSQNFRKLRVGEVLQHKILGVIVLHSVPSSLGLSATAMPSGQPSITKLDVDDKRQKQQHTATRLAIGEKTNRNVRLMNPAC